MAGKGRFDRGGIAMKQCCAVTLFGQILNFPAAGHKSTEMGGLEERGAVFKWHSVTIRPPKKADPKNARIDGEFKSRGGGYDL